MSGDVHPARRPTLYGKAVEPVAERDTASAITELVWG